MSENFAKHLTTVSERECESAGGSVMPYGRAACRGVFKVAVFNAETGRFLFTRIVRDRDAVDAVENALGRLRQQKPHFINPTLDSVGGAGAGTWRDKIQRMMTDDYNKEVEKSYVTENGETAVYVRKDPEIRSNY